MWQMRQCSEMLMWSTSRNVAARGWGKAELCLQLSMATVQVQCQTRTHEVCQIAQQMEARSMECSPSTTRSPPASIKVRLIRGLLHCSWTHSIAIRDSIVGSSSLSLCLLFLLPSLPLFSFQMPPTPRDTLTMTLHTIYTLTRLREHELLYPLLTDLAVEAVRVIRVVASHDRLVEDGLPTDVAAVGAVGAHGGSIGQ